MCRARIGGGFGPVIRQTMNEQTGHINSISHSTAHSQFWDEEDNLQIRKVLATIMNNRSKGADKG
jgi:hypothetical protein